MQHRNEHFIWLYKYICDNSTETAKSTYLPVHTALLCIKT
jgi:hypothetical protein